MCELFEKMYNEAKDLGRIEGRQEGLREGLLENVRAMTETLHFSVEQALDALKVPKADQPRYLAML